MNTSRKVLAYPSWRERAQRSRRPDMIVRSRARSSVVEQLAFNQLVVGSIPTGLTKQLSVVGFQLSACERVTTQKANRAGAKNGPDARRTKRGRRGVQMVRRGGRASPTKQTAVMHARGSWQNPCEAAQAPRMRGARCEREEAYKSVRRRARASATKQMRRLRGRTSPSSRGLGHRPFTAATRVRIPLGTPMNSKTCDSKVHCHSQRPLSIRPIRIHM